MNIKDALEKTGMAESSYEGRMPRDDCYVSVFGDILYWNDKDTDEDIEPVPLSHILNTDWISYNGTVDEEVCDCKWCNIKTLIKEDNHIQEHISLALVALLEENCNE